MSTEPDKMSDENKKFVGEWWIPGKARRKVKGTLYLSPAGAGRLELIGLFKKEDLTSFFDVSKKNPEVIFGEAGGKSFSLFQNELSNKAIGLKIPHATLTPRLVLEGFQIKNLSERLFTDLVIEYNHLEEWCAENTFYGDLVFNDERPLRVNVTGIPFVTDPINLPSLKTDLVISHNITHQHRQFKRVELTDTVTMKFAADGVRSFEWFEETIEKFQVMLALFTGRAVYAERFALRGVAATPKSRKGKISAGTKFRVRVYYDQTRTALQEDSDSFPVIVPFSSIKTDAFEIINKYLESYEDYNQVFQLLLASVYQPDFLAQSRFLNLMQAIETFHRRSGEGKYLSVVLHDKLKIELAAAYEEVFKRFSDELSTPAGAITYPDDGVKSLAKLEKILTKRLDTSNEVSLRSRMELIFKGLSKNESELVCDKPGSFVHHTTSTRDYLTHYDKAAKAVALTGVKLFQATEGLRILLLLLIMRELGVERDLRVKLITDNERLNCTSFKAIEFE